MTEIMHRVLGMELMLHKAPKWAFFCTPRGAWRNWSFRDRNASAPLSGAVTRCLWAFLHGASVVTKNGGRGVGIGAGGGQIASAVHAAGSGAAVPGGT